MGARGPLPKPTALRVIEGNRSHRPLPVAEPQPKQVAPKCPSHLDKLARREWKRLVPILRDMRVLTEADYIQLGLLCSTYSRLIQAQEALNKSSLLIKSKKSGYVQMSPLLSIINTCTEQLAKLCAGFGLNPASRARIQVERNDNKTSDSDLIR
jgi:P27 family predicted phage terminase small subunit